MKSFIVFALIVAAVAAAPQLSSDANAEIVELENDNIGVDGYKYGFRTSNGIEQVESGVLKNAGSENEAMEVQGEYSYVDKEGNRINVKYIANENGFQAFGAHLPQAP